MILGFLRFESLGRTALLYLLVQTVIFLPVQGGLIRLFRMSEIAKLSDELARGSGIVNEIFKGTNGGLRFGAGSIKNAPGILDKTQSGRALAPNLVRNSKLQPHVLPPQVAGGGSRFAAPNKLLKKPAAL